MAVDIKNLCDYSEKIRNVTHILTETLGTTTSYTFLEDTLRPYVKKNLKEYVLGHWNDDELVKIVKALEAQAELEMKEGWVGAIKIPEGDGEETKEAVISYALSQIDGNNLDALTRLIVKDGYSKGNLKGHVFPDVIPAFKKWTEEGKKIYMYSSGMEMSQECLMSNSVNGDITELISGCFESSEFPKAKCESFRELCKKVDSPAEKVALLTHSAETACAARKAGLVVIMLSREGNLYLGNGTRESFPVISSFEDISKQICGKRKKAPDAAESTEGKRAKLEESASSEKEAEAEKSEEKDAKSSSEEKPAEEAAVVADAVNAGSEAKVDADEEEKMEVDQNSDVTEGKVEKAEEGKEVKEATQTADEVQMKVEKANEEVGGGADAVKKTEETKVDEVEKDKQEEVSVKSVDGAEKVEVVAESKEENSKEVEDKKMEDDGKTEEVKVEEKKTKDGSDSEAKADEGTVAEDEKNNKMPTEDEKTKENGISAAVTVANGEAGGDAASKEEKGSEKKELNGNGVTHVNGEGDGVAGGKVTEPAEKETEKIVAKKVDKDESQVELATEAATESA